LCDDIAKYSQSWGCW